jgi:hypothetical protein
MNRRSFLALSAVTPLASLLPAFARNQRPPGKQLSADVVIVGAGVGGIAAALSAAKSGLKVILTEENLWIGGQLTAQGVPPDEHPWIEKSGCTATYRKFRSRVRDFYRNHYPLTEAAAKNALLNPGNGSVSKLCHEPRVALAVLLEMLAPYLSNRRVILLNPYYPVASETNRDKVKTVTVQHQLFGNVISLTAPYFVDATELGDLLDITRTEYVIGAESQKETQEPHAPEKANPKNQQAFTICFAMDYEEGATHVIDKPKDYEFWANYVPKMTPAWPGKLLSWQMSQHNDTSKVRQVDFNPNGPTEKGKLNLFTYRRIIDRSNFAPGFFMGDTSLVNWPQNDYWLGNLIGVTPDEARKHLLSAKQLSLSLLYWMQTAAPRENGKAGWPGLRLRGDLFGTPDGLAEYPYIRESRRIQSEFTITEQHVGVDARAKVTGQKPGDFTAEQFPDSVGLGSYRIDLHPSTGGDNYIDVSSLPFQIPLGSLIPKRVENLLPACKNLGTTHITNGSYRLHPVEWNIGESVGHLVAYCLKKKEPPRKVRSDKGLLTDFQSELTKAGVELEWSADLRTKVR